MARHVHRVQNQDDRPAGAQRDHRRRARRHRQGEEYAGGDRHCLRRGHRGLRLSACRLVADVHHERTDGGGSGVSGSVRRTATEHQEESLLRSRHRRRQARAHGPGGVHRHLRCDRHGGIRHQGGLPLQLQEDEGQRLQGGSGQRCDQPDRSDR